MLSQAAGGSRGGWGTVVRPPCRWPVRRPCQPCTMSYSGPSSVQKVPPRGPWDAGASPSACCLRAPSGRAVGGRGQHQLDCQGSDPSAVGGVPVAPWHLTTGAVAVAWRSRVDWELQAQPSPRSAPVTTALSAFPVLQPRLGEDGSPAPRSWSCGWSRAKGTSRTRRLSSRPRCCEASCVRAS